MISKSYQNRIKKIIEPILEKDKADVFIFGSAARAKEFGDVDIAVSGKIGRAKIRNIKASLEGSDLPYFFDVVDLSGSGKGFRDNVLNNKIIWLIKH